jgi:hypothetical protein
MAENKVPKQHETTQRKVTRITGHVEDHIRQDVRKTCITYSQ